MSEQHLDVTTGMHTLLNTWPVLQMTLRCMCSYKLLPSLRGFPEADAVETRGTREFAE